MEWYMSPLFGRLTKLRSNWIKLDGIHPSLNFFVSIGMIEGTIILDIKNDMKIYVFSIV